MISESLEVTVATPILGRVHLISSNKKSEGKEHWKEKHSNVQKYNIF
jgi:hypothetical protein